MYERATEVVRRIYDSRIATPPVLDPRQHFPGAQRFVAAWPGLRDEALAIAANLAEVPRFHELMPQQADVSANDARDWRMLVLKAYGVPVRGNQARCPRIAALVESDPDVLSATLSFLAPHKHIPPHRGPFRGIIRFHLGLVVPLAADGRPAAVLTVDGQDHRIGDGESLLWDDTFMHEVHNRCDAVRIALLLDIRRRGMPLDLALLSRALIRGIGLAVRWKGPFAD